MKHNKMRKRELHGISMIPFGLLAGFAEDDEIRITELAEEGFCFRTLEPVEKISRFRFCFYDMAASEYQEVAVTQFELLESRSDTVGIPVYEYTVYTEQGAYRSHAQAMILQYDRFVRQKLSLEEGEWSEAMCGYPAKKDADFAKNLAEQKRAWFAACVETMTASDTELLTEAELALELDRPELYEQYAAMPFAQFLDWYWQENKAVELQKWLPVPTRLYLGNAFCHLLFPPENQLFVMLEKAREESLAVTVTFSYVREYLLTETRALLERLAAWCRANDCTVEIVVNDWSMFSMLADARDVLVPCFGTLLNKRKKDPRMCYKKGNTGLFAQNSVNASFYRTYLEERYGIQSYEWESCGYTQQLPETANHLHVPFYQTNTSQYCPLYAVCKYGERSRQELPVNCPGYCSKQVFLYPKHLNMVGRYNSLFALDERAFLRKENVSRIVVNLL